MCASWSSEFGIYKYKGSVEDFIRLFINSKALLQTLPTINSPPLRSAYKHYPLLGVDISKLRRVWTVS